MNEHDFALSDLINASNAVGFSEPLTAEKIEEMVRLISKELTPYELAERSMNTELKKKGLPNMDYIMDVFYETYPEHEL